MTLYVRKPRLTLLVCALVLLIVQDTPSQVGDYIISKGDQLLITVWGYPEFSGTQTVRDNGYVLIPLAGEVPAAGLRRDEFVSRLQQKLVEYIQGEVKVTVSVSSSIGQRVTVLGSVSRPDNYPVASEVNLLEIITMAGGYLPDANLARVKIFRKDPRFLNADVDLQDYIERADIENLPRVHPGDIVFVPRQQNFVREFGEFFRDVVFFFALFRLTEGAIR
jgi:polysaccharide export outer membrane protein